MELLTYKQAAEFLGMKEDWLMAQVHQKKITYVVLGRLIRFKKSDLEEYVTRNTVKAVD